KNKLAVIPGRLARTRNPEPQALCYSLIPGVWISGSLTSFAPRNDRNKMQWTDECIVIGVKRHGEASGILELMTREHGRHFGLVRGGFGSRLKPVLQTGNSVAATWRARLDEHLGNYTVEPMRQRASNFFAASHAI